MRKILLTLISFVAISALVACGGGSSSNTITVPSPPSGGNNAGFSNGSLSGSYVFAANGISNGGSFAVAGTFTADGNGNITSGVRDTVNDSGGQTQNESISGTYDVNQDGRGQAVLNGPSGQVVYRFVLQSSGVVVGKLFQIGSTSNSTLVDTVGRIELQSTVNTNIAGTYVIRLDGEDGNQNAYGAVGGLVLSGGTVGGTLDENDDGTYDINGSLAVTSGSYGFSANGRGSLAYVTPNSSAATPNPPGNHNFIAYYVNPSRFEVISTDPKFFLHGYAQLQTSVSANTAGFTGGQVFSLSGFDNAGERVETGQLTLDGLGGVGLTAIEDVNDANSIFQGVSLAGSSYIVGAGGRWTANLANTPTAGSNTGLVGWQISPQQSVVLTTSTDVLETGTMRAQTLGLNTASVTGNYAQDFSGTNATDQSNLELTGNLLADGNGNLAGTYDSQTDDNGLTLDAGTTGNYTVDPTIGRSVGNIDGLAVDIYVVDASTIYIISTQQFDVYNGMMVSQQ